ncbi:MAG TPA: acetate--CoA ligase family protein, partial [bacterium]|nr:acetate--CoA ligase family protein [bacterium]
IVKNLIDFEYEGPIYPVGPKGGDVFGLRIFESLKDIDGKIDLAVFLIPAKAVVAQFETCAELGVKRVCISSGGFSELGEEGKVLEEKLLGIARENDMRFLGPNCISFINQDAGVCLPFVRLSRFQNGSTALLTQSGGVGLSFINMFQGENIGINKYVSLGNKLNIGEPDLLPFLEKDPNTKTVCMYLEEVDRGREFMSSVRSCTKPIVIMKSNTTESGARMAKSHTAAVANDDKVVDAAFKQLGIGRVKDLDEIAPSCKIFDMPPMKGNRVAIITPTGGYAVILADMCDEYGFEIPPFPPDFIDFVSKHVRAGVIKLTNPLDLGDMFEFQMVSNIVARALQGDNFDAIILSYIYLRNVGIPVDTANIFPLLDKMLKIIPKPVILSLVGDPADISQIQKTTKYPIFSSPEESLRALALLRDHSLNAISLRTQQPVMKDIDEKKISGILDAAAKEGRKELGMEALEIVSACGIRTAEWRLADSPAAAAAAARDLGFPVAMKIASPDILHKTEVKGVRVGINTAEECEAAFGEMVENARAKLPKSDIKGVYVQKMVKSERELLIGAKKNDSFGH